MFGNATCAYIPEVPKPCAAITAILSGLKITVAIKKKVGQFYQECPEKSQFQKSAASGKILRTSGLYKKLI